MRKKLLTIATIVAVMGFVGCQNDVTTNVPTVTPTSEPQLTGVPESEPTKVPQETVMPETTETPIPTSTPTPEPTATPTSTPTPEPTATPEPTSTPTPEPTVEVSFEKLETEYDSEAFEYDAWVVIGISNGFMYENSCPVSEDGECDGCEECAPINGTTGKFTGTKNGAPANTIYYIIDNNNVDALAERGYIWSTEITEKVKAGAMILYIETDYYQEIFVDSDEWSYNLSCKAFYVYGATEEEMVAKVKEVMAESKITDITEVELDSDM